MDAADRSFICIALGFTAALIKNENLPADELSGYALSAASRIETFCDDAKHKMLALRMATVIADTIKDKGGCLPQDVIARGFTADDVDRHWRMARALAAVQLDT